MTNQEILENLCYYDERNPDNSLDCIDEEDREEFLIENKKKGCACDNCFYSRTELAEELLKYIENN